MSASAVKENVVAGAMQAPVEPQKPEVQRDSLTGGLVEVPEWGGIIELDAANRDRDWMKPGRYYASSFGKCIRMTWFERKNVMARLEYEGLLEAKHDGSLTIAGAERLGKLQALMDEKGTVEPYPEQREDEVPFVPWKSEPGNVVERGLTALARRVFGFEGVVLQDIRFSKVVELEGGDRFAMVAKSDPIFIGDNFEVLRLEEMKTPIFGLPKKKLQFAESMGRTIPLPLAKIDTPDEPDGIVSIDNALQLAFEAERLASRGMFPKVVALSFIERSNFWNRVSVTFSLSNVEKLAAIAELWAVELHTALKSDKPPAPLTWRNYGGKGECHYCPFKMACEKAGGEKAPHPVTVGLNARLTEAAKKGGVAAA